MRALTIAIALFLLSASLNIVYEAYGGSASMQKPDYGEPSGVVDALMVFGRILKGAVLFGHSLANFAEQLGMPLPSSLVIALDGLGATAYAVALAQFVRGVPGGGIE